MCLLQLCVVILAAIACGQQFNSSPTHSLAHQHVTSPHDTRMGQNRNQQFQFVSAPIQQNKVSSREVNQIGSTQAFRHSKQTGADVQERFQQPPQAQSPEEKFSLTTARNIIVPFLQVSSQEHSFQPSTQTFQTVSFPTSRQGFQPSSSFSAQQQIPGPVQQNKRPAVQAKDQTFQTTNQRSAQIKATSVQKTVHQAQQLQNGIQQAHILLHQQQRTQGATRKPPSSVQTFITQQFSTQTQPLTQQQSIAQETSFHMLNPRQQTVHEFKSTQLQQQQSSQKKAVQNQQTVDVTMLSPEEELFQKQARNAKYSFHSTINDNIMDNNQVRQEKRNGLELSGLYSYSDGFYKRTVHYKADEHGYRVTK
jgi:hypothetical protein